MQQTAEVGGSYVFILLMKMFTSFLSIIPSSSKASINKHSTNSLKIISFLYKYKKKQSNLLCSDSYPARKASVVVSKALLNRVALKPLEPYQGRVLQVCLFFLILYEANENIRKAAARR